MLGRRVLCRVDHCAGVLTANRNALKHSQDNEAGLPLGIQYNRHLVTAGVQRKLTRNTSAGLQYGFFRYREPTALDANDYTALALMASFNFRVP